MPHRAVTSARSWTRRLGTLDGGDGGLPALERAIAAAERRRAGYREILGRRPVSGHEPGFVRLMLHLTENELAELRACRAPLLGDEGLPGAERRRPPTPASRPSRGPARRASPAGGVAGPSATTAKP